MRVISTLCTLATAASALSLLEPDQAVLDDNAQLEQYLIEVAPGDTRWICEDEKWRLRRVRVSLEAAYRCLTCLNESNANVASEWRQLHGYHQHSRPWNFISSHYIEGDQSNISAIPCFQCHCVADAEGAVKEEHAQAP